MSFFKPILVKSTFEKSHRTIAALCLSFLVGLGLVACANAPFEGQLLPNLRVNEVVDVGANGETVRWGGTIASIENSDEGSIVEIVSRPLNAWGRPKRNDQSDGRFIARIEEVMDSEKVKQGMDVTTIGELIAVEEGLVGEMLYKFPVMTVSKVKVWQPEITSVPYAQGYWKDPFNKELPHSGYRPHSATDPQEGQFKF